MARSFFRRVLRISCCHLCIIEDIRLVIVSSVLVPWYVLYRRVRAGVDRVMDGVRIFCFCQDGSVCFYLQQ